MVAIDEAKLDKLYRKVLKDEKDYMSANENARRARREYRQKLRKEKQEIIALREERYSEPMQAADSIFNWLNEFAENPKGRKILSTVGAVVICPIYPESKLREGKGRYTWLSYDRKGVLRYQESNGGIRFLQNKVLANPQQMVSRLHPNYILSVLDDITTGKVWKTLII